MQLAVNLAIGIDMEKIDGVIDRIGTNGPKVVFTILDYEFAYTIDENTDLFCLIQKGDAVSFKHNSLTVLPKSFVNHSMKSIGNL